MDIIDTIIISALSAFLGFIVGSNLIHGRLKEFQREAVKNGFASFKIDEESKETPPTTIFKWNDR